LCTGFHRRPGGGNEQIRALRAQDEIYVEYAVSGVVHVGLGETDQAFAWLQRSYAERERWLVTLQSPVFDPLRSDPRFADLVRRVRLWQKSQLPK